MDALAKILAFRPPVGQWWPKAGGFRIGTLGRSTLILGVVLDMPEMAMPWAQANAWARSLRILGFCDYSLPTLKDFDLLHQVVIGRLGSKRFWSRDAVKGEAEEAHTYCVTNGPTPMPRDLNMYLCAVRHHHN